MNKIVQGKKCQNRHAARAQLLASDGIERCKYKRPEFAPLHYRITGVDLIVIIAFQQLQPFYYINSI